MTTANESRDLEQIRVGLAHEFPPAVLEDYFTKREIWFAERHNIPDYGAGRDAFDEEESSQIVLAARGQSCLGGVRLTVRREGDDAPFPIERIGPGLSVRDAFPDLGLHRMALIEMSRLVIVGDGRNLPYNNRILLRMALFLLKLNQEGPKAEYAFLCTSSRSLRLYRQIAKLTQLPYYTYVLPPEIMCRVINPMGELVLQLYQLPLSSSGDPSL